MLSSNKMVSIRNIPGKTNEEKNNKKIDREKEKKREIDEHSSRETDLRNPPDPIANACEDGPWRQTEVNKNTIDTHISITVLTLYQYKFLNLCLNLYYKFHNTY